MFEKSVVFVAGLSWVAAGLTKIVYPAPLVIFSHRLDALANVGLGVAEVVLGGTWFVAATRTAAAITAMCFATAFAAAILLGLVDPESCGCFGRVRVSRARHLFVLGLLIGLSCVGVIMSSRRRHNDQS